MNATGHNDQQCQISDAFILTQQTNSRSQLDFAAQVLIQQRWLRLAFLCPLLFSVLHVSKHQKGSFMQLLCLVFREVTVRRITKTQNTEHRICCVA